MANPLYKEMSKGQESRQQNPREAAMNLMRQQGIDVPKGMENNPQALLQHVLQSGRVPQNRLGMAQMMLKKMYGM